MPHMITKITPSCCRQRMSTVWGGRLRKRFCNMFSESSTGSWAELKLPCCPSKQEEFSENMLQNLFLNLPPQTVSLLLHCTAPAQERERFRLRQLRRRRRRPKLPPQMVTGQPASRRPDSLVVGIEGQVYRTGGRGGLEEDGGCIRSRKLLSRSKFKITSYITKKIYIMEQYLFLRILLKIS